MSQNEQGRTWSNHTEAWSNASYNPHHPNPPEFPGAQMNPRELSQYPPQVLVTSTALATMGSREIASPLTQMNAEATRVSRLYRDMVRERNLLLIQIQDNRSRAAECQIERRTSQQLTPERIRDLKTWIKQYNDAATQLQRQVANLEAGIQRISTELDQVLRNIGLLPAEARNAPNNAATRYGYPTEISDTYYDDFDSGTGAPGSSSQAGQSGQGYTSYGSQYQYM